MNEVVCLKNGSVFRGVIIEQIPNTSLKVQLRDKSSIACRYDEIEKITKENVYIGSSTDVEPRKPGLAWMLSFFFPGAGQIYNGQKLKGVWMMVWGINSIITILSMILIHWGGLKALLLSSISMISVWVYSQIDAPVMANKLNKR